MSHTNKFLKPVSTSSTSSTSSTFLSPNTRINSFLSNRDRDRDRDKDKDVNPVVVEIDTKDVEEFPVLGGKPVTLDKESIKPPLYKTALLTKINQKHIEEQARIQKALRREIEAKEARLRQLEMSSMRERFVEDAIHDRGSMAYDEDTGQKYSRRDDYDE
jgi:hypothetical protein